MVLLLAHDFPPDNSPGAARPYRFAKYLPAQGFDVHVIAADCEAVGVPDGTDSLFRLTRVSDDRNHSRMANLAGWFQRYCLPYNERLPWVPGVIEQAAGLIAARPDAILLSTSPAIAAHLAAMYLKLRYGVPWFADFRDPVDGNPFRVRWGSGPYNRAIQRLIIGLADRVLTVTDSMPSLLPPDRGGQKKTHVLWNGYDPAEEIGPRQLPTRPYRVIRHIGSVYGDRRPDQILRAAYQLMQQGTLAPSTVKFQFTGHFDPDALPSGDAVAALLQWGALEMSTALVPRREALEQMCEADSLLLLDGNKANLGYTVPAKLFEYIRVGRPILATTAKNSPVERILAQSGLCYISIQHDDSDEQARRKLMDFLGFPNAAKRPSDWFHTQFDGIRQTAALAGLLRECRAQRSTKNGRSR
jgi:hypothetical protein